MAAAAPLSSDMQTTLAGRLAAAISEMIVERRLDAGAHLNAAELAKTFNVSRFPIREALVLLDEQGVVEARANRGFFVKSVPSRSAAALAEADRIEELDLFFRLSRDRLAGEVPDEFTESDLIRRYGLPRAEVRESLERLAREGWVERRLGYGWSFAPLLTSPQALSDSYRLRKAFEPAGLMDPSFQVDPQAFDIWRAKMRDVIARPESFSIAELFEGGSRYHEMLMACTNNPFFLDTLKRQNRLRRMIEYRVPSHPSRTRMQAEEHVELLDRLQDGDFLGASVLMNRHLDVVSRRKLQAIAAGDGDNTDMEALGGL